MKKDAEIVAPGIGQIQAKISACKSHAEAWDIINSQPKELESRLRGHAKVVFAMRKIKS